MVPSDRPLEPSRELREHWLRVLGAFAQDVVDARVGGPSSGHLGASALDVADAVSCGVPEAPLPGGVEAIVERLGLAATAGLVPAHAGYLAYVPGAGLFASALADLVAGALNRFTGLSAASPALCRLEADVLDWLAAECGYGESARGVLLSGGSLANLGGVITAREEKLSGDGDLRDAIAYASDQAHHCVDKAFRMAGVPASNVRRVPTDDAFRMDAGALSAAICADRDAGRRPFVVVASAGTTNTGALDPLDRIADVCRDHDVWLHADGAYGGAFVLCDEGRALLAGLGRADSIALDPHKGLFLPFGTGCLLVRDGAALRRAHGAGAHYLRDFEALDRRTEAPSPTEHGPELSRSYRGLRLWLPLVLHGAAAFRDALAEKLVLARRAHAGLEALAQAGLPLDIVAEPQLSTLAFRLRRAECERLEAWNARNTAFVQRINAGGRVHLSTTLLPTSDGAAVTLRVCVLNPATDARRIDAFVEDTRRAAT